MRKYFRDCVRQCDQYPSNTECNPFADGYAQTLSFWAEIFSSFSINPMGSFTKPRGQDSVLVMVVSDEIQVADPNLSYCNGSTEY